MKKSSFVAMVLGTISGVLFALGMCMALLPEWNAFKPGVVFGCVGVVLGIITVIIWRKMEGKQPVKFDRKAILTVVVGIIGVYWRLVLVCVSAWFGIRWYLVS